MSLPKHTSPLRLFLSYSILLVSMATLVACGGAAQEKIPGDEGGAEAEDSGAETVETTRQIFHYVPTPVESSSLLERSGADYNADLLNAIENVSLYETVSKKAINLGIYTTDLSYASIYEQSGEIMVFSACAKKLSDALGVTEAFSENTLLRIESNIADKDSILQIITETYYITDTHLKMNQRANLSGLILAGGWIEGLYIASKVIESQPDNQLLVTRLLEQKHSLQNLLILAGQYSDDVKMQPVLADLREMHALFEQVEERVVSDPTIETDTDGQSTTINTGRELTASEETIAMIREKASEIRSEYIQP